MQGKRQQAKDGKVEIIASPSAEKSAIAQPQSQPLIEQVAGKSSARG